MPRGIVVGTSTSLVLIKTLELPYTPVYLSTLLNLPPNFNVSIRDVTGSSNIINTPIVLSTTGGAFFSDGTFSTLLNEPYGLIDVSLRNSNIWRLLHTSGLDPAESAGSIDTLSVDTIYVRVNSSINTYVSTLITESLVTANSIQIQGTTNFKTLSTLGNATILSSFNLKDSMLIQSNLYVSSSAIFFSSLQVYDRTNVNSLTINSNTFIGGSILVNGITFVGNSLNIVSSLQISTLQLTQSTGIAGVFLNDVIAASTIYILSNATILGNTYVDGLLTIQSWVSTTSTLSIGGSLQLGGFISTGGTITSYGNNVFLSSLSIKDKLSIGGTLQTSTLSILRNLSTLSISTQSISTLGCLNSLNRTIVSSFLEIDGTVSSQYVSVKNDLIINNDFFTLGSISTSKSDITFGNAFIRGTGTFYTANIGSAINSVSSIVVSGNVYTSSLSVVGSVSTQGSLISLGNLYASSLNVHTTGSFEQNMYLKGNATIPSFDVGRFYVSTTTVLTNTFVSTTRTSTLFTNAFILSSLGYNLSTKNAYISSIQVPIISVYHGVVDSATTSSFFVGTPSDEFNFFLSTSSYFAKGFSTINLSTNSLYTSSITALFIGDGSALQNVVIQFSSISSISLYTSTTTISSFYTSSLQVDSLIINQQFTTLSTIQTPTIEIDAPGFAYNSNKNQILEISPSTMIWNRYLYFDASISSIGLNTSTPTVELDINGGIYFSTLLYSSIQVISVYDPLINAGNVNMSSLFIRETLNILSTASTGSITFGDGPNALSFNDYDSDVFTYVSSGNTIDIYHSSIVLNNLMKIGGSNNKVGVAISITNPSIYNDTAWPAYDLDVYESFGILSLQISTLLVQNILETSYLQFSSLSMYGDVNPPLPTSTNQILTFTSTIVFNNLLYVDYQKRKVGFGGMPIRSENMYVNGNAYFSTLSASESRVQGGYVLGMQTL